ncbi:hypothetical protein [Actinocorallia herbida]|uniref:hypothetical protein n=1 Tax=Actinocorallia herbida TaxID=58109 RepID=UPI000F4C6021|nr:hypothetical protein [Actinocorallia herbida]
MSPVLVVLGSAVAVIAVMAAVLVVLLTRDDEGGGTPTPTGPAAAGFEADYAGTWSGEVIQIKPSSAKYLVVVVVTEGSPTATIKVTSEPGANTAFSCSGTLTFLHHTPKYEFKSVVQESITDNQGGATCDAISYSTLFPDPDNSGGASDGMYYKNYFNQSAADADEDHNAIGELKRQAGAAA